LVGCEDHVSVSRWHVATYNCSVYQTVNPVVKKPGVHRRQAGRCADGVHCDKATVYAPNNAPEP